MSLTSELQDSASPLRRFLADELPDVRAVRAAYRTRRPADLVVIRPAPPDGVTPAYGTLGLAIDHRIRLVLSADAPIDGAVRGGVELVGTPRMGRPQPVARALRETGRDLMGELNALVADLRPFDRGLTTVLHDHDEERLARACVAAAWFEEVYRTKTLWPRTPLGDAGADLTLDVLLAAVPPYAVADVTVVTAAAYTALADMRATCAVADVHVGPRFAGSTDVGGADADWIAAGLLVDVKATLKPATVDTDAVYQLVCYALLDYDNRYGIERVGWYLARVGWLVTWDLDEFLGLLGAARPLDELRASLAAQLGAGPRPGNDQPSQRERHGTSQSSGGVSHAAVAGR